MSKNVHWHIIVALTALGFIVLIQVPQFLHIVDPRYQGVLVHLQSDEYVYQARVEEALQGRPEQTADAIIGTPGLLGSQFALLETVIGTIFSWTGWRAPTVLQVMDSIVVGGLFLSLLWFFRQCGFRPWLSYVGAVFFILLQLNNLNRPIHPGGSFLLMLTGLNLLIAGYKGRIMLGILGGIILGPLIGVYVWSWTFAWVWWGVFLVWEVFAGGAEGQENSLSLWERVRVRGVLKRLLVFTLIGVIVALPFFWQYWKLANHPLYAEAVFRSGMHPSRLPESWAYSVLFMGMFASVAATLSCRWKAMRGYRPAIITVFTAFIVIHQQVIHGTTFNFISHYLLGLVLAATCVLLLFIHVRSKLLIPAAVCAVVYLAAVGYDGRWVFKQFSVDEGDFSDQYLASAFPALDTLERKTILTDPVRSLFLAGSTKHDVLYTVYVKNILIPHTEIAERYCLTVLPLPPSERHIEEQEWLIYPDAVRAFAKDLSVREREVSMVKEACDRIDHDPVVYLRKYGVTYVFWDEKLQPQWELRRLRVPLEKMEQGEGWLLWKLKK